MTLDRYEIRQIILEEITQLTQQDSFDVSLQQSTILMALDERLNIRDLADQRILLSEWYALFNTGYLSWGHNLNNPNPPFFHVNAHGQNALIQLSRDPANPEGYLAYLESLASLNPIAISYIKEGLSCYVAGQFKASAVMLGGSNESLIIELRKTIIDRLEALGKPIPAKLKEDRIKVVIDAIYAFFESMKGELPYSLREEFLANWPALTQQIRSVRNDAGHPTSIEPVSPETAHASFLLFTQIAKLITQLTNWVDSYEAN